mmetsp:Transcript_6833/g.10007  ORF Transcript_6833/g.10007 Transcript_6833/m.10007 type:complete len:311 (+) Transcript_6833:248-1180(+)
MLRKRSGSGSDHQNFRPYPENITIPTLEYDDLIYKKHWRDLSPVVIEEYNLIFFVVAKAASSEWKRFFMRLEGNGNWCGSGFIHKSEINGLSHLNDYSLEEAQEMMTSRKWTRAMFVRHPKPRLLSAFLDKAVGHKKHFEEQLCTSYIKSGGEHDLEYCRNHREDFDFFLRDLTATLPDNVHWMPESKRVDEKWWPFINYIATMEELAVDAEHFLQTVVSNIDNVSAWDRVGRTGWSEDERHCDNLGTSPFLGKKDTRHKTDANSKMNRYYTPELENYVEDRFSKDLNNDYFSFTPVNLFETSKEGHDIK